MVTLYAEELSFGELLLDKFFFLASSALQQSEEQLCLQYAREEKRESTLEKIACDTFDYLFSRKAKHSHEDQDE